MLEMTLNPRPWISSKPSSCSGAPAGSLGKSNDTEGTFVHRPEWFLPEEPRWLDAIFTSNLLQSQLETDARGTTGYAAVRPRQLLKCRIPLPNLQEQRRIVGRIEQVSVRRKQVSALRRETLDELDNLVVATHLKLSGNRSRKLGELVLLDERPQSVVVGGSYPQVGVKSFGKGLFPKPALLGTDTTYRAFNRLYNGALVLSQVKGWEGAVAVCPPALAGWFVSPEYRTFRCIEGEAVPDYLDAIVRRPWFWHRLSEATHGAGARRERTRPERFLNLEIPMPSALEQADGIRLLKQVEAARQLSTTCDGELNALLPSLLDRAFKGGL